MWRQWCNNIKIIFSLWSNEAWLSRLHKKGKINVIEKGCCQMLEKDQCILWYYEWQSEFNFSHEEFDISCESQTHMYTTSCCESVSCYLQHHFHISFVKEQVARKELELLFCNSENIAAHTFIMNASPCTNFYLHIINRMCNWSHSQLRGQWM